jgi:acyl-CoA reductase-like NAD-dependent aldehyde dehydrogenase
LTSVPTLRRVAGRSCLALADVIDAHAGELAALESTNVGKPHSWAAEEVPICADELPFFDRPCPLPERPGRSEYVESHTSFVRREPLGIVGSSDAEWMRNRS